MVFSLPSSFAFIDAPYFPVELRLKILRIYQLVHFSYENTQVKSRTKSFDDFLIKLFSY